MLTPIVERLEDRLAMAVFAVTNTNDSGDGSLRDAILQANALAGTDRIVFAITSDSKAIALSTPLPWLEDTVEVDGTSQPGFIDHPLIELDGAAIGVADHAGLVMAADNSIVRGLAINNFFHAIVLNNTSGAVVAGNHLGVNGAGNAAIGNRITGVYIIDSTDNLIGGSTDQDRNVVSGNNEQGIRISGNSTGNRIQGNFIGTDSDGLVAIPNKQAGILVGDGAGQNIIGTDGDGKDDVTEGNIIAGNLYSGVQLNGTQQNIVAGNRIGIGAGEHTPLANGADGVGIAFESSGNIIGTNRDGISDDLEANIIASNQENGVRINNSRVNHVAGNFIGVLGDGITSSANDMAGVLIDGGALSNTVGVVLDTDASGGNIISANGTYGVWIVDSRLNSVKGNRIGRTADDTNTLANLLAAVRLTNSSTNDVGLSPTLSNSIGYTTVGILVDGTSQSNSINHNSYTGDSGLAIDLNGDGVTANDTNDVDTGPNALQNFPVIDLVTTGGIVSGTLNSRPYRTYRLSLVATGPATDGVGIEHNELTSFSVQTNSAGIADWFVNLNFPLDVDQAIAALAYELSAGTSEFSPGTQAVNERQLSLASNPVNEGDDSVTATVFRTATDATGDVVITLRSSDTTRATVPTQVVIPANAESAQFTVVVLDDQWFHYDQLVIFAEAQTASNAVELTIVDNDNPWHHYGLRLDVSGDGLLSAIDALLIINVLNTVGAGSLADREVVFPPVFVDVNDDGNVTSLDALLVINALNTGGSAAGEGEAGMVQTGPLEFDGDLALERMFGRDVRTTILGRDARATRRGWL